MKKTIVLLLAALTVLSLTACNASADTADRLTQPIAKTDAPAEQTMQSAQAPAAVQIQTAEPDATPDPLPEAGDSVTFATPAPAALDVIPVPGQGEELTAEAAQAIALAHAGLSEGDVTYVRTHHDWDDGCAEYEIEFYCGDKEYDYDIDACTGAIRSFDTEIEHHSGHHKDNHNSGHHGSASTATPAPQSSEMLTKEEAKMIALTHAGISEAEAVFEKVELDTDDGRREYEIEFRVDRTEYEYDIDAVTGKITKADKDYDD